VSGEKKIGIVALTVHDFPSRHCFGVTEEILNRPLGTTSKAGKNIRPTKATTSPPRRIGLERFSPPFKIRQHRLRPDAAHPFAELPPLPPSRWNKTAPSTALREPLAEISPSSFRPPAL